MNVTARRILITAGIAGATGVTVGILMNRPKLLITPPGDLLLDCAMLGCIFAIAGVIVFHALPMAVVRVIKHYFD